MANKKEATVSGSKGGERIYLVAGIVFAIILGISIVQFVLVNANKDRNMSSTLTSVSSIYNIKTELVSVNRNVLMVVAGLGDSDSLISDIHNSFDVIKENEAAYEAISGHSEQELKRYNQAKLYITALDNQLIDYENRLLLGKISLNDARTVYIQELAPYQTTAIEMFDAVIEINNEATQASRARGQMITNIILGVMVGLLIIGEIGIFVAARIAKAQREEVERKERQAAAADIKFKHSQEKINDIAFTNILTGMKNRYGLENDIGEKLDTEQFNIAVFDMDNFRSINDIYGYDFGDEYLVQLSERLKNDFGHFGEIYNITGNEFCIVYNREVSDFQAQKYSQDIFNALSSVYNVANIGIQLTVSGSTYHYLAGDCMNLSALLVKMDNALRNAKRGGGNTILSVSGI